MRSALIVIILSQHRLENLIEYIHAYLNSHKRSPESTCFDIKHVLYPTKPKYCGELRYHKKEPICKNCSHYYSTIEWVVLIYHFDRSLSIFQCLYIHIDLINEISRTNTMQTRLPRECELRYLKVNFTTIIFLDI